MSQLHVRLSAACCLIASAAWAQPEPDQSSPSDERAAIISWLKHHRETIKDALAVQMEAAREGFAHVRRLSATAAPTPAAVRLLIPEVGTAPLRWTAQEISTLTALPDRLVLLVHGLDEPGGIWDDAIPTILAENLHLARFDYSNDQSIVATADELAAALRSLRAAGVKRVDLVCHSMGGLAARDVLTRDSYYNGDAAGSSDLPPVDRFILVGVPNRGSAFAGLQAISEMREHALRILDTSDFSAASLTQFLRDGRGEAAADLEIDSAFLKDLNSRPLPRNVRISVIAGRIAEEGVADALEFLDSPLVRQLVDADGVRWLKTSATLLHQQVGDGVVSVESASLPGVSDTVVLNANHQSLLRHTSLPGVGSLPPSTPPEGVREILKRLRP